MEEIEEALRSHGDVSDCVVILREDTDGDKRLVAYVVAARASVAIRELRNFLKAKLPSYMVPAGFGMIESLPLMPNGKIDRRALPEPNTTRLEPDESLVPPRTPLEAMLADAWREVLKMDQIGIHENFFDLGGHSVLVTQVVARIRNVFQVDVGLRPIFERPTIAELAETVESLLVQEISSMSEEEARRLLA